MQAQKVEKPCINLIKEVNQMKIGINSMKQVVYPNN